MKRSLRKLSLALIFVLAASLLLAACGGSSASKTPVTVNITLTEFKIDASMTEFQTGVPYHFVVTNKGTVQHELYIMAPETGTLTPAEAKQKALAGLGPDQLNPGATASFDYTFKKSAAQGTLEFACHLPGHYEAGMHTSITVK